MYIQTLICISRPSFVYPDPHFYIQTSSVCSDPHLYINTLICISNPSSVYTDIMCAYIQTGKFILRHSSVYPDPHRISRTSSVYPGPHLYIQILMCIFRPSSVNLDPDDIVF